MTEIVVVELKTEQTEIVQTIELTIDCKRVNAKQGAAILGADEEAGNCIFTESPGNILINPTLDPASKTSEFKVCAVSIELDGADHG